MISFKTVWKDPVLSKVIAVGLIWILSNLFIWFSKISNDISNWNKISLFSTIFLLIVFCFFLWKRWNKLTVKEKLRKLSGDKISLTKLKTSFPNVEKISVVGRSSVGKTTLIENICRKENENKLTRGKGAYIRNFSNRIDKFAAMLDGSGQSQSEQNDIAVESEIIIVLLDHNSSRESSRIDRQRIQSQRDFLLLLKDRFKTSNHTPKWIHFLLNKQDLWSKLPPARKTNLQNDFQSFITDYRESFKNAKITFDYHSNEFTRDRTKIMDKIAENINL